MGNFYQDQCHIKRVSGDDEIARLSWIWPNGDRSGWDGPKDDWLRYHSRLWFTHVKKFDVVVQAGGMCGMYPRMLAERFNKVITFEPIPLLFYCLVNNCQNDKIVKLQAALGDEPMMVTGRIEISGNVGVNHVTEGNDFPQITLDSLELKNCDLLALDVEQAEVKVLKGAINTINRLKPVIVIETLGESEQILKSLGYRSLERSAMDTVFIPINN